MCSEKDYIKSNRSLMFNFEIQSHTRSFFNEAGEIKFDPPVYEQRYALALRILEHELFTDHIKTVVDFGTAEMALIPMIKQIEHIHKVVAVDIERKILETHLDRAKPYLSDHIKTRANQFSVEVYEGSISEPDPSVIGIDVVLAIEIIEHVFPVTLNDIPYNIFGVLCPKVVLITTPNSEFNVLFELPLENGFRHYDHKFEWTRRQFKDWSFNICERFPNYLVSFFGAGIAPPDYLKLGPVTQIALFVRKDVLDQELVSPIVMNEKYPSNYKLVHKEQFPFNIDERSKEEKVLDEAKYHINRLKRFELYLNAEQTHAQIPVIAVFQFVENLVDSSSEMVAILNANDIQVKDEFIVVEIEEEDYDDGSMGSLGSLYDYETRGGYSDDDCDEAAG
ncbi:HENMT1 family protein [Megaselia abdita]